MPDALSATVFTFYPDVPFRNYSLIPILLTLGTDSQCAVLHTMSQPFKQNHN